LPHSIKHAKSAAKLYKPDLIGMSPPRTMVGLILLASLVASLVGLGTAQATARPAPRTAGAAAGASPTARGIGKRRLSH
jgi:hypothetical protein